MTAATQETHAASAEEVLTLGRQFARPLAAESVSLEQALGRVLRAPVCAPEDQPPFDRSAMDGFAVRLDDSATRFRMVDEIRAGDWKPRSLQPGECVRMATGGALPGAGLQVVVKEDVRAVGSQVELLRRSAECHIRFRGEDARQGQELVRAGAVLSPGALALLASVGHTQPVVTRLPRALHVVTGNEIVPPDQAPARGQIRDSNSTLVRAFLSQFGIEPRQLRVPEDEVVAMSEVWSSNSEGEGIDLLLLSGGASVGEHDFTCHGQRVDSCLRRVWRPGVWRSGGIRFNHALTMTGKPNRPRPSAQALPFSHLDKQGAARMVNVGAKPLQHRRAVAAARLVCQPAIIRALRAKALPKGDVLAVANVAGIQAAKRTSELIPLCHPLPLDVVQLTFELRRDGVDITCAVETSARTGVEMEALTGASVAALTLYDMCKAVDKTMRIEGLRVLEKAKS
jgi:molybdenum cofactor biosynthesis protein MoaC